MRVVRPDMRGFGRSSAMPRDYAWSPSRIADDYVELMDQLGVDRFHVVGAKVGGTMALHFAARHPTRVKH
jgi:3-oxoadipate enol-lactonase